jgi:glycosyltransferase involved in cell wall biosynthesis
LVEAALSGCAIVANEIATFHELWDDTVFYYAHNDPAALRKSLNTMNDDGVLRREYADRAYRRATTMFSADQMVDRYLRLYGELVQGRSSELRAAVPAAKAEAVS